MLLNNEKAMLLCSSSSSSLKTDNEGEIQEKFGIEGDLE